MNRLAFLLLLLAAPLPAAAKAGGGASAKQNAAAVPAPPAGMGQVVFYRSFGTGKLLGCRVGEEGEVVNRLPQGKYFVHPATPGIHQYETRTDLLQVEVKEGETRFVRCLISGLGVLKLSLKDQVDFSRQVRGLRQLPPWTGAKDEDD